MNDTLPIIRNYQHHLHIRATLKCLFWSWRQFCHPLRRLNFCFNIVAVHQSFITCYDIFQKVFISIRTIKQLLSFCASVSRRDTNFAAARRIFSLSVKIRWYETLQFPTSSATSRTVRRRFWRITASIFSTWSSSNDVEGRPDLGSSSMDVLPDLKR